MSKISLITYSTGKDYELSKKHLVSLCKESGFFDDVISYSFKDLGEEFLDKYRYVMSNPRSAGHSIWKIHLIEKTLKNTNKGDIVIYLDSGATLNYKAQNRFNEYIQMLNDSNFGNLMFENPEIYIEKHWTTKKLFDYFKISPDSKIGNSPQLTGGQLMFKNNEHTKNYVNLFYKCIDSDQKLITDYYNDHSNHDGFVENRHDQSIWSLLTKTYGGIIIGNECEFRHREDEQYAFPFLSKVPFVAIKLPNTAKTDLVSFKVF